MSSPTSPDHDPSTAPRHDSTAEDVFRTSLRTVLVLLGALLVIGTLVGWLVAGAAGVWGALVGVGLALVFSGLVTLVIGLILKATMGWRVSEEAEVGGIDLAVHGETAYETLGGARVVTEVKA